MTTATYWRVIALKMYSSDDLELSAIELFASGNRVDAAVAITCAVTPTSGSIALLQDSNTTTTALFSKANQSGFALVWNFTTPVNVDNIRLGSGALKTQFPKSLMLQYSSDGLFWETFQVYEQISWPGSFSYTLFLALSDQNYARVSLLLHGDGPAGSTVITDSGPAARVVTIHGTVALEASAQAFGGSHIRLGSAGYLTVPNGPAFDLSSGAWTVEARLFPLSLNGAGSFFSVRASNQGFTFAYYNGNAFAYSSNSGNQQPSAPLLLNQYNHLEYSHDGTTFRIFVNGELKYSSTSFSISWSAGLSVVIGASELTGQEAFDGYIEELQVTKGVALHTAAFTPPTSAYSYNTATGLEPITIATGGLSGTKPIARAADQGPVRTGNIHGSKTVHTEFSGRGRISGTVKIKGSPDVPAYRRVRLIRELDGILTREQFSNPITGSYDFRDIDEKQVYTVITYDYLRNYRAVITDNLTPELMPGALP